MILSGLEAVHSSEMSVAVTLHIGSFQRKAMLIKFAFSIIVYLWVVLKFCPFLMISSILGLVWLH
jgi:hypothetical protein